MALSTFTPREYTRDAAASRQAPPKTVAAQHKDESAAAPDTAHAVPEAQRPADSDPAPSGPATMAGTLQDGVMHSGGSGNTHARAPRVRRSPSGNTPDCQIRDFPREVMDAMEAEVGGDCYMVTLLSYLYLKSDGTLPLPEEYAERVMGCLKDRVITDPQEKILARLDHMRHDIAELLMVSYQGAIASEYVVLDAVGLRERQPVSASDMDFSDTGMEDIHRKLRERAKQMKKKDAVQKGGGYI